MSASHPSHFDPGDPALERLRGICLALPGAAEKISHGRPYFFTKKTFAIFGATVKGDHSSGRYECSLVFMPNDEDRQAFAQDDRFFVPAYWGPHGWMGLLLLTDDDWAEAAELVEDSFRNTAGKRLIAELDALP